MTATCPKDPTHKRFHTTAHVMEEWLVDEHGEFIESKEFLEVSSDPDPGNLWFCAVCGAEAKVINP